MARGASIPEKVMINLMVTVTIFIICVMFVLGTLLFWRNKDMVLNQFSDRVSDLELESKRLNGSLSELGKVVSNLEYGHSNEEFR